jgi:hypothetical protein
VREQFGTRWLSTDYRMGDVVIFSTRGLHATLDNRSRGFRLSIDVRFQPEAEVTDPRFAGANPVAHRERERCVFDHVEELKQAARRWFTPGGRPALPAPGGMGGNAQGATK